MNELDSTTDAPLATVREADATRAPGSVSARRDDEVVARTVTINRPREELYAYWRELTNLPRFMENIERIDLMGGAHDGPTNGGPTNDEPTNGGGTNGGQRSHWVVLAPAGQTVEWDAVITEDIPGRAIAWTSTEEASVRNSGRVEFRDSPVGRGTEVTATIVYDPPLGTLGKLVAKLFAREPKIQVRQDLRRFKQLMETGEIATARMQPAA